MDTGLPFLSLSPEIESGSGCVRLFDSADRGALTLFRKPASPDPFVNSRLTSLGVNTDGVEQFWTSCVNNLIGATSRAGNLNPTCATGPSIYSDLTAIRSWIDTQVGGLPA